MRVCANGAFSQMMGQKSGKIINISFPTAYWGTPNFLHYIASKAALIGMARSWREKSATTVSVLMPSRRAWQSAKAKPRRRIYGVAAQGALIKRIETLEALLGTLVFLYSLDSDFITV